MTSTDTRQPPTRTAELLAALSLATDLGAGKPMGHAQRACCVGLALARQLRLPAQAQAELYYALLLMHSGCTALSLEMSPLIKGDELAAIDDITLRDETRPLEMLDWMRRSVSPGAPLGARVRNIVAVLRHSGEAAGHVRGMCEVAFRVAQRLDMPPGVPEALRYHMERWDGQGPYGRKGEAIPLNSRLMHLALMVEAYHAQRGRGGLADWVEAQKGRMFDPALVAAFEAAAQTPGLWDRLAQADVWAVVLDLEPESPQRTLDEAQLDDAALAVADFVDLKSPVTFGHSRETAAVAEGLARHMRLPEGEVTAIRQAALVHDLGHVALPAHLLRDEGQLSEAEKERLRLHPYFTERVLARVPALAEAAALAGKHHERLDGTGYYKGLSGDAIPVGACILALADAFEERQRALGDPAAALAALRPEVGAGFSPACFEALEQRLAGTAPPAAPRKREWPKGLTDREVEVLRLLARGLRNREIATELVITEKTVGHHLEHIYNKLGVSSRAAAVFFAMEHELIK